MSRNTDLILKGSKRTREGMWVALCHKHSAEEPKQKTYTSLPNQLQWTTEPKNRKARACEKKHSAQVEEVVKDLPSLRFWMKPLEQLWATTSALKGSFREITSKRKWTPGDRQPPSCGALWEFPNSSQMEPQPSGKGEGPPTVLTPVVFEKINSFSQPWTETWAGCTDQSILGEGMKACSLSLSTQDSEKHHTRTTVIARWCTYWSFFASVPSALWSDGDRFASTSVPEWAVTGKPVSC